MNILLSSPKAEPKPETFAAPPPAEPKQEEPESDVELDLLDTLVQPDNDEPQEMGDDDKEATEEEIDQAGDLRGKAAKAYSEGNFEGEEQI